jgi:diguanylate cyclase (GGDEF)-like protein
MMSLWQVLRQARPAAVATKQVMIATKAGIFLIGGFCTLLVILVDRPTHDVFVLTALPVIAFCSGLFVLAVGKHLPLWVYHLFAVAGNALVTGEVLVGHDLPIVGATIPIYLFVIVDAAFFFSTRALLWHLLHVLAGTVAIVWWGDVPWQSMLTFDGVMIWVAVVIAYICRVAGAIEVDSLTGLVNRRGIDRHLEESVSHAEDGGLALILLDLDGFKEINDNEGHQLGDEVLRDCAARWSKLVPRGVELGRYGGDEFAIIAPGWTAAEGAMLADSLRSAVPSKLSASAGVAEWEPEDSVILMLERADVALYAAKADGRDRTVVYGQRDPGQPLPEPQNGPRPPRLRSV